MSQFAMSQSRLLELQAESAQHKADLATLAAEAKRFSFLLDDKPGGSSPRRRHFKGITQVNLPIKDGDLHYALIAICEEGRAWRKYQGERWTEIEPLPTINPCYNTPETHHVKRNEP
jgi:hypothetical protein